MHLTKQALAQYLQIYIQNKNWWLKSYHMVKGKWSVIIIMKVRCHHIYINYKESWKTRKLAKNVLLAVKSMLPGNIIKLN